ncbi:MAG: endonuclease Q family protein [Nanoarchaeota archaeon]|nr:endonuclease Q family protein [Nanoarchaeota archaeon]
MEFIADLHIHGKYSRACSKELTIPALEKWAKVKGITLLGTGDFTHPKWIEHIKEELNEDGSGFLRTKTGFPFILQTEISLIYSQGGRGRRVHILLYAPTIKVAEQITEALKKRGRVDYDGRPIFKIPCKEIVDMMRNISEDIEVVPAHCWTPWFAVFGSNGGFDSLEEAFGDNVKHIHALETGISSDPMMNWRLSKLDKINLVSFSDLHSYWPWRLGREATIFGIEPNYKSFLKAIRTGEGIKATIEADPAYGKYHVDGHRNCNVQLEPAEAIKLNNICPVCNSPLTIGVLHRVEELADRKNGFVRKDAPKTYHLIPLSEIIATVLQKGIATRAVWDAYNPLIEKFGNELNVLMNVSFDELKQVCDERIAKLIIDLRERTVKINPGYDGVYGNIEGFANPDADEEKPKREKAPKEKTPKAKKAAKASKAKKDLSDNKDKQKGLSDF